MSYLCPVCGQQHDTTFCPMPIRNTTSEYERGRAAGLREAAEIADRIDRSGEERAAVMIRNLCLAAAERVEKGQ